MATSVQEASQAKSLLRRIIEFPLVAMLIAMGLLIVGLVAAYMIAQHAIPLLRYVGVQVMFDLVAIPIILLIYKLVIVQLGERPRDEFRLEGSLKPLAYGLVGGFALFSLIVAVAAALGVYQIAGPGDFSGLPKALIASAIFPAISEEIVFRGVLFRWLEEFGGSWAAIILTSAFFGAGHLMNPSASPVAAFGIAVEAGVMLGAAYMLTRSLWLPMGLHAAWNFTQGEIYDIPVSGTPVHGIVDARLCCNPLLTGNGFGLEASLIAMIIATLFGLWLLWLAVKRGEVMKPWWVRRRAVA
jgi:membrane protease YdiL (CAAX protease family)